MTHYCDIAPGHPLHGPYHDTEYGFPVADESALFERLVLEINQAGLSWLTILKKKDNFRQAFDGFDIDVVARYGDKERRRLLSDSGIIRNRLKVESTVNNARTIVGRFLARLAPDAPKRVSVDIVADVASSFINTFWNTYGFFVLYARLDKVDLTRSVPVEDRPEIDRWALALLHETVTKVTDALDHFDARTAGEAIESFVDQLSNWYVRRNRRRFWKSTDPADKQAAYLTLYECLVTANKLMAPFVPFLAESVYQNLVRGIYPDAPVSVHMTDWPVVPEDWRNDELLSDIDVVQKVVGLARAARGQSGVRTRQPLSRLLVRAASDEASAALEQN